MGVRGYDHLTTGVLLTRLAGSMFIFAPLAGRLIDRLPARFVSEDANEQLRRVIREASRNRGE
jgi:hypothetical protein